LHFGTLPCKANQGPPWRLRLAGIPIESSRMKLVNVSGPQDVTALLLRRKWWVLLPFLGLSAAVILITVLLPEMFVSQSRIVITPRDVPTNFVKDPIPGTTAERLSIFTEQFLSASNLQAL